MTEYITSDRIANSILQKDLDCNYLIVEGKTDFRLLKKFVNDDSCKIEIAFGNIKVVEVIERLKKEGFNKATGIIDSDFRILDNEKEIEGILTTDYHDLEISLINSPSFETVMSNYCQIEKLEKLYTRNYSQLKKSYFELAKNIGYLKWLNKIENLGLTFKPANPEGNTIDYNVFISANDLNYMGDEKLVNAILNFCNGKVTVNIKKEEILEKLTKFKKEVDLNHLCNGHDIMNIISISLRKHISNLNSKSIPASQLEKEFSLAYESRYFMKTSLYEKIKNIEQDKKVSILTF
ncbi:hypothetical protein [Flavobacterium ginsenosidimutans]|uniref:hypothetical protein n=1 Tax=Flavobacterium ginsenosidimutans TaxID=687844 RepID=UPI003D95211C